MSIGYACKTVAVKGTNLKSLTLKNADQQKLDLVTAHNLAALLNIFNYNRENNIGMFRISSDIIPFGSHPDFSHSWQSTFRGRLEELGGIAMQSGLRLSMHPGQYTVLNSPDAGVVKRAVLDLEYHADFLDALGLDGSHKIILHVGGVYGDKPSAAQRFADNYMLLPQKVKNRLVVENDDRCFTVQDVLEISRKTGAPVVYDNLHNSLNPSPRELDDSGWIKLCGESWNGADGKLKTHYSQQAQGGRPGAHSETINAGEFMEYYSAVSKECSDIMLEVKDKNRSALKCILCTENKRMPALEKEWGRYKYLVMEHDLAAYQQVRALLKDKTKYPALEMFRIIETALEKPVQQGSALNAAQHVWGYFKNKKPTRNSKQYKSALEKYLSGTASLSAVKKALYRLASEHEDGYLLQAYYFEF